MSDAAEWADIMMMLIPDELQADVWKNHIEQRAKEGSALAFAHGLNVHFDLINARPEIWMCSWLHQKDLVILLGQNLKKEAVCLV